MKPFAHLSIRYDGKNLEVIDQRQLPDVEQWIRIETPQAMIEAIKSLAVRGAPLIGVAAALSLALYRKRGGGLVDTHEAGMALRAARPTAVNLMVAMDRMLKVLDLNADVLETTAENILHEEVASSEAMAKHGAELVKEGEAILTHCNTGGLATAGIGTALGVIRRAHEQKKKIHVFVDETRPLLQGARLTAWELEKLRVPYTLICDNMAASLMRAGRIQRVFVGADRIALNGDFANKIGTYSVAVLAKHHGVDFHMVAPVSTIDLQCESGEKIPIEERNPNEVRGIAHAKEHRWSPRECAVWNPSFDVTPADYLTSMVLDRGVHTRAMLAEGSLKKMRDELAQARRK